MKPNNRVRRQGGSKTPSPQVPNKPESTNSGNVDVEFRTEFQRLIDKMSVGELLEMKRDTEWAAGQINKRLHRELVSATADAEIVIWN